MCTAGADDAEAEVFTAGQSIQGCDLEDDDCISVYKGTLESCHRLAAHSMTGHNKKLMELHVGSWMSYNELTRECYLWSKCNKLSSSSTTSSFQYCGVSHKAAGEYPDYYDSDYYYGHHYGDYDHYSGSYDYSDEGEEEDQP